MRDIKVELRLSIQRNPGVANSPIHTATTSSSPRTDAASGLSSDSHLWNSHISEFSHAIVKQAVALEDERSAPIDLARSMMVVVVVIV